MPSANAMKKQMFWILCSCAWLLALSGCGRPAAPQEGRPDLTRTLWNLSTFMGRKLVAGPGITAVLTSDGKISGSSGCNLYTGGYRVDGNSFVISWLMSAREKNCSQEIMDLETAYLESLAKTKLFTASRDQLTLKDADGDALMIFMVRTQDPASVMDQEAQ